jgi:flagellar FliJ protein
MRKFRFRLQGLANLKGAELDALRQEHAAAQAELRQTEGKLLATRAALDATYNELMELRLGQADPTILLSLESYCLVLRDQALALQQRVARQRHELAEAHERLVAKHREKKVLEKYRERKFTEYSQNVQRELQKEIDEAASHVQQDNPLA